MIKSDAISHRLPIVKKFEGYNAMQKGNLIVTTKKVPVVRLAVFAASFPFFFFLGIYCLNNPEAFRAISPAFYKLWSYFFGALLIAFPVAAVFTVWNGQKSYVCVYESCIEGRTFLRGTPFELPFSDIICVRASKDRILILTKCKTYRVLAMGNRDQAVSEIQKRMAASP